MGTVYAHAPFSRIDGDHTIVARGNLAGAVKCKPHSSQGTFTRSARRDALLSYGRISAPRDSPVAVTPFSKGCTGWFRSGPSRRAVDRGRRDVRRGTGGNANTPFPRRFSTGHRAIYCIWFRIRVLYAVMRLLLSSHGNATGRSVMRCRYRLASRSLAGLIGLGTRPLAESGMIGVLRAPRAGRSRRIGALRSQYRGACRARRGRGERLLHDLGGRLPERHPPLLKRALRMSTFVSRPSGHR
jgi:hypothetical protein